MSGEPGVVAPSKLDKRLKSFFNEYQTVKIKKELRDNWGLVYYARYTRGFYVSFKMELDALVFEAEKRRKSTREKQYRTAEMQALEKANKRLYGNTTI